MSEKLYEKAGFWLAVINSFFIIGLGFWNITLTKKSIAEPKFKIAFEPATPVNQIFSQKANPHWIFKPSPDMYNRANRAKIDGKKDCIHITNVGKRLSPQTFVEITVKDPFSIALISVYVPEYGWLDSSCRTVRPSDEPNYQKAVLEITRIIGKKQKLEVYPVLVYAKTKRKKYEGKDKIDLALKVRVHSNVLQEITSPSENSFSLEF